MTLRRAHALALLALPLALGACGHKADQVRTVTSYEFSACNSDVTTQPAELAAIDKFKDKVTDTYFTRTPDGLFAANREATEQKSELRQYRGSFYTYVHPLRLSDRDREQGIDWAGMLYLHAESVRVRPNGADWGTWERVRTRNFLDNTRTSDGLTRWKCLINAEIAWARLVRQSGVFRAEVQVVGAYDAGELEHLKPTPSAAEISGEVIVAPLSAAVAATR